LTAVLGREHVVFAVEQRGGVAVEALEVGDQVAQRWVRVELPLHLEPVGALKRRLEVRLDDNVVGVGGEEEPDGLLRKIGYYKS
jgi:hypothetical protein